MIKALEDQKLNATESELQLLDEKMEDINAKFDAQLNDLYRLQSVNEEEQLAGNTFTCEYFQNLIEILSMKYSFKWLTIE